MRAALTHLWRPVGAGVMPATEVRFLVGTLFAGGDGRAAARRLGRLPGLAGLRLVSGVVDRTAAAVPPSASARAAAASPAAGSRGADVSGVRPAA